MRCAVEHHPFPEQRAGLRGAQQDAVAVLSANKIYIPFEQQPHPLAGGRFVEKVIARMVAHCRAALEHGRQFVGFDADPLRGVGDSFSV